MYDDAAVLAGRVGSSQAPLETRTTGVAAVERIISTRIDTKSPIIRIDTWKTSRQWMSSLFFFYDFVNCVAFRYTFDMLFFSNGKHITEKMLIDRMELPHGTKPYHVRAYHIRS